MGGAGVEVRFCEGGAGGADGEKGAGVRAEVWGGVLGGSGARL